MKIKTSELQDLALDWAVAQAEGNVRLQYDNQVVLKLKGLISNNTLGWIHYRPSAAWQQGGPIIEREGICLSCVDTVAPWDARIYDGESEPCLGEGDTPLIAAMRCYVASKLGDEVEIPEELKGITA